MSQGKRQRATRRSLPNAEGTPILGYEASGRSQPPAARSEILSAHSKHTKTEGDTGIQDFN